MPNRDGTGPFGKGPRLFCKRQNIPENSFHTETPFFPVLKTAGKILSIIGIALPAVIHLSKRLGYSQKEKKVITQKAPARLERKLSEKSSPESVKSIENSDK